MLNKYLLTSDYHQLYHSSFPKDDTECNYNSKSLAFKHDSDYNISYRILVDIKELPWQAVKINCNPTLIANILFCQEQIFGRQRKHL